MRSEEWCGRAAISEFQISNFKFQISNSTIRNIET